MAFIVDLTTSSPPSPPTAAVEGPPEGTAGDDDGDDGRASAAWGKGRAGQTDWKRLSSSQSQSQIEPPVRSRTSTATTADFSNSITTSSTNPLPNGDPVSPLTAINRPEAPSRRKSRRLSERERNATANSVPAAVHLPVPLTTVNANATTNGKAAAASSPTTPTVLKHSRNHSNSSNVVKTELSLEHDTNGINNTTAQPEILDDTGQEHSAEDSSTTTNSEIIRNILDEGERRSPSPQVNEAHGDDVAMNSINDTTDVIEENSSSTSDNGTLKMSTLKEEIEKVETKSAEAIHMMELDEVRPKPDPSSNPSRPPSPLTSPPANWHQDSARMPPPSSSASSTAVPTPLSALGHPVHVKPKSATKRSRDNSPSPSAPVQSTSADASLVTETASQKPKSTVEKKARIRSPSPDAAPPPKRAPLQTVRLDIRLGGPDNYAVDVRERARETGQRELTPEPEAVKRDTSDSEPEGETDAKGAKISAKGIGKGKAGKKKHRESEYYDLEDPFIDDSELALDERTFFAQTKQQGFYVSQGEVALLKDRSAPPRGRAPKSGRGSTPPGGDGGSPLKKPKSKKIIPVIIPLAGAQVVSDAAATIPFPSSQGHLANGNDNNSPTDPFGPPSPSQMRSHAGHGDSLSVVSGNGTRDVPITLSDGDNGSVSTAGLKRKASDAPTAGKKKRKVVEIEMFHPDLQPELRELRSAAGRESFEVRGKFPPALKPLLARVALKAIACGEYGDAFFSLMPRIFPYNKYTMSKLIKRTVYVDHQKVLAARQEELLEELAKEAQDGFVRAREEHEKAVAGWEKRQHDKVGKSAEGTPVPGTTPIGGVTPLPTLSAGGAESLSGGEDANGAAGAKEGAPVRGEAPPPQRFRLTERLRNIIWELVVLSNESVRIENEKNTLENSTVQVSEQGTRKGLYQRIVAAFPEGWMSSGQISREVSVMKKRFEAQQAEEKENAGN